MRVWIQVEDLGITRKGQSRKKVLDKEQNLMTVLIRMKEREPG